MDSRLNRHWTEMGCTQTLTLGSDQPDCTFHKCWFYLDLPTQAIGSSPGPKAAYYRAAGRRSFAWSPHLERKKLEMKDLLSRLWKEEDGQDLTEYALLVVLVALGSVAAMGSLSQAISKAFSSASANLTT
jgi:pilus assembly protein Flp/PilA